MKILLVCLIVLFLSIAGLLLPQFSWGEVSPFKSQPSYPALIWIGKLITGIGGIGFLIACCRYSIAKNS